MNCRLVGPLELASDSSISSRYGCVDGMETCDDAPGHFVSAAPTRVFASPKLTPFSEKKVHHHRPSILSRPVLLVALDTKASPGPVKNTHPRIQPKESSGMLRLPSRELRKKGAYGSFCSRTLSIFSIVGGPLCFVLLFCFLFRFFFFFSRLLLELSHPSYGVAP